MGSKSDYEVLSAAVEILRVLEIPHEARVLSAHRTPDQLIEYVETARGVPVGTLAIGKPGAANAALLAAEILALTDAALYERLARWRAARAQEVLEQKLPD